MALHINLYHEVQRQERQRSRDPLRLGMYGILVVILICVGYYFFRQQQVAAVVAQADQLHSDWEKYEPQADKAKAEQEKLQASLKLRDDLIQRIEGRFYWAPVLQKFMEVVPREAQITHMTCTAGAPKDGVRTCSVSLAGIATGAQPRDTAELLRKALHDQFAKNYSAVTSTFKSLDDSTETVAINGQNYPTVSFSIELDFTSAPVAQTASK